MNKQLSDRKYIIGGIFVFVVLIYICRLFYIQNLDEQYKDAANNNAFRNRTDYPPRGFIFDRNGKKLVVNEPSYDLTVIPIDVKGCDTMALCKILDIDKKTFIKRIEKAKFVNGRRKESSFEKALTSETYAKLQEKMFRFKGFYFQKRSVRNYPRRIGAHLLGYIGEVSKEKAEKDPYYKEGDYIGVSGIEKYYEEYLRGKKGVRVEMVDVHNQVKGSYMNGKLDTAGIAGVGLTCCIDADLQEYGEKLMRGKKGSIVAIEPSTGEILCLVSSPAYDPNLLVGHDRAKNFSIMYRDTVYVPLFNRATQAMYPPGSIFKLIDALVGQNDGVLGVHTVYPCAHGYPPMGGKPACHGHPAADLTASIQFSCNSYYSYVFRSIVDQKSYPKFKDGYEHWRESVMSFGVGKKLGYDIPYEKPGNVPSVNYYNKVFGENGWRSNTIVSLGIGQAELTIVPIQMANVMCAIANHGYYYIPHVIKAIDGDKKIDKKFYEKQYTAVQNYEHYENVINGMQKVVESGTGTQAKLKDIIVCGKTGTAQNPHGEDHAVFVAFAPRENPKIAIACVVENAGFGGTWSAPTVGLLIEKYLTGKITRPDMEKRMLEANLIEGTNLFYKKKH
ncbi:MAG: peptidoglycan D,D-transpeptidase FtsI family protein [Bacteroidia bacterium]